MARPRFNDRFSHVPLFVWVLVELMRDRKDSRPRDTVRAASKRLQTKLAQDFEGGRVLPTETIRRYYKNFEFNRAALEQRQTIGTSSVGYQPRTAGISRMGCPSVAVGNRP